MGSIPLLTIHNIYDFMSNTLLIPANTDSVNSPNMVAAVLLWAASTYWEAIITDMLTVCMVFFRMFDFVFMVIGFWFYNNDWF
ncbi:MAG: hypothetical protein D6732_00165 [Methanobacteriota archaeon]|nr:MAG: hypothetical protein D6732_00165 [Euryarchaeota archaeon]